MEDSKNKGKDISGFLNRILFSEEKSDFEKDTEAENNKNESKKKQFMPSSQPDSAKTASVGSVSNTIDNELVDKIYAFLKSIDKPGVDFLELWNVTNAMDGGINETNIKTAYTTLKIVSQNALTLKHIESTGLYYKQEIETLIKKDVSKKEEEKTRLNQEVELKKGECENKIKSLKQQIESLTMQLDSTEKQLNLLSLQYEPQIKLIDKKISNGIKASNAVVNEIESLINLVKNTIKE